jgi:enoyl-CoA hydratase
MLLSALPIDITREGPVMIIQINRPKVRNAINKATADLLRIAWDAFDKDQSMRVAVLTGGNDVFSAGADMKDADNLGVKIASEHGPLGFTRTFVDKPVIAAVAGYCVAGGLEMACWCDLRIADETAIFGCFQRRFGVPLIDGGTVRLPQIIGLGRAMDMILTGRAVDADEAKSMGLVSEVVPKGKHIERAVVIANQLAKFPQTAMLNDRRSVYEGIGRTTSVALQVETRLGLETIRSGETAEGTDAFRKGKGRGGSFEA